MKTLQRIVFYPTEIKFKLELIVWKLECAEPGDIGEVGLK